MEQLKHDLFTPANFIGGLLFSGIGFVAFVYGKKMSRFATMLLGLALMVYPYFIGDTLLLYAVGCALIGALYFTRDASF